MRARIAVACVLGAVALVGAAPLAAQEVSHGRLEVVAAAEGLHRPTAFDFPAPGELFVFEKATGHVVWVRPGEEPTVILDLEVNSVSERGGLGLVLDPDFADNGLVYLYYSAADAVTGEWTGNRLERYRFDGQALVEPLELLFFARDPGQANGPNHDGGTLRFGPDGMLYGVVGDLNRGRLDDPRVEQNTAAAGSAGVGGIFRIAPDGSAPEDNPFADHPDPALRIWMVYGVRNGFGLAFDPLRRNDLWFTENGPNVYDEVNRADPGMNSGWLKIMGPDSRDAAYFENGFEAFDAEDLTALPGSFYRDPEFSWLLPVGVTAIAFVVSDELPRNLRRHVLVGDTNTGDLYRLKLRRNRRGLRFRGVLRDRVADTTEERLKVVWGSGFGILTDIRVGPDGLVYLSDLASGRILRIQRKSPLPPPPTR